MRRAFLLLVVVAGCGGGGGVQPPPGQGIEGAWTGGFYEPQTTVHGTVSLTVSASSVAGSTQSAQGNGSFSLARSGQAVSGSVSIPGVWNGQASGDVYPETPETVRLVVTLTTANGRQVSMSLRRP